MVESDIMIIRNLQDNIWIRTREMQQDLLILSAWFGGFWCSVMNINHIVENCIFDAHIWCGCVVLDIFCYACVLVLLYCCNTYFLVIVYIVHNHCLWRFWWCKCNTKIESQFCMLSFWFQILTLATVCWSLKVIVHATVTLLRIEFEQYYKLFGQA